MIALIAITKQRYPQNENFATMTELDFNEIIERSKKIRECYHLLERQHHGVNGAWKKMLWLFLRT